MDLERELRGLAIAWPPTPELRLALEPRRTRSRRPWLVLAAAIVAAIAAAFAVPQSRGAILRFFHIGAVTVKLVDTLPPAQERPLTEGLGRVVTLAEARQVVRDILVPPGDSQPTLHSTGYVVSLVFSHNGEPVLLNELPGGHGAYLKKMAASATKTQWLSIDGHPALFLSGGAHIFFTPGESARLAGNVLLWEGDNATYRLEGKNLAKDDALSLARSLRYPGKG